MNKLKDSIDNGLVCQFLLGRGKYFVLDRDWGAHDSTSTYSEIVDYLIKYGELNGHQILESSLEKVLDNEFLSTYDLMQILGIIWSYFINRFDNKKLKVDWEISKKLKSKIKLKNMNLLILI